VHYISAPILGAMKYLKFRQSIHSQSNIYLRSFWIKRRKELGLSQRDVAERLQITHSLIGKIETGDRRLDIIEMIDYAKALEVDPHTVINLILNQKP